MKHLALVYLLPAIAALVAGVSAPQQTGMYLCNQAYALCTSALCVPDPSNASKSICFCDVEEGGSMSTLPCHTLRPTEDENGVETLYSTFSLKQYAQGKKAMQCPTGAPWSNCLNKRCTVDPTNPKRAICICDIMRTEEWMTLGGECDTESCKNGYWSGATLRDNEKGSHFIIQALGLKHSPVKWCPASS